MRSPNISLRAYIVAEAPRTSSVFDEKCKHFPPNPPSPWGEGFGFRAAATIPTPYSLFFISISGSGYSCSLGPVPCSLEKGGRRNGAPTWETAAATIPVPLGPAGPISLKTVHWTVFRALDVPGPCSLNWNLLRPFRVANSNEPLHLGGIPLNITSLLNALPGAAAQGLIWGIMAIGVYITYRVLDLADLTVDGTMATGGAVCVMLMLNGWNVWLALLCAVVAGMLAGLLTGLFHTAMGIPPILSGILTQLSLYSVNLAIMDFKANQGINVTKYPLIVSQRNVRALAPDNPIFIALLFLAALIGILYWFFGTELGSSLRSTGANEAMSRAQGINTNIAKILGLMISNGIVALSSALLAHYQGFVDVNMGRGAIVIGLAAVIISDVLFGKLFRNFALKLVGVAIGAVIYYIVIQVVLWLGLNTNLLKLLSALIVAVFLAVPYWRDRAGQRGGRSHA